MYRMVSSAAEGKRQNDGQAVVLIDVRRGRTYAVLYTAAIVNIYLS
jgi:hypothetical protein